MSAQATADPAANGTPEAEDAHGVRIGDKIYPSPGDFTLAEAEKIMEEAGITPQELILGVQQDPTNPTFIRAIAWVVLNREKDGTDWNDRRMQKISIAEFFVVPEEDPDARPPAGRRKRSS